MALVQIDIEQTSGPQDFLCEDILAVSRDAGGILVLKGEKAIVRVSLNKAEAGRVAATLAPHIP